MLTTFSEFLTPREERFKPKDKRIQSFQRIHKIDFSGKIFLSDKVSNTDMILVKKGDLVISGINVEKGALAVYEGDEDITATIHYSSYSFDIDKIDIDYLKWFLRSQAFIKLVKEQVPGGIKTEIKPKHLLPLEIDLPNPKEQKQIVKRFANTEKEYSELESEIAHQQSLLKKLRQAILQDSVQGKLVKQDKNDEPASELLKRIKAEKEKLIVNRLTKWEFPLHKKSKIDPPYSIPKSWVWVRLWDVIWCFRGHNPPKMLFRKEPQNGYVRFIQITDFKTDRSAVYVPFSKHLKLVEKGEILMAAYRHIGKISRNVEGAFNVALCKVNNIKPFNRDYLELLISSELIKGELLSASERTHIPSMHSEHLLSLWVPIPPPAEQERIVEKVNFLYSTCDKLEKQIEENMKHSELLLQAVLKEAFEEK